MNNAATSNPLRKAAALVVTLLLAALAFGVGLPWIIAEAPPGTETLWAREVQAGAPTESLTLPAALMRPATRSVIR